MSEPHQSPFNAAVPSVGVMAPRDPAGLARLALALAGTLLVVQVVSMVAAFAATDVWAADVRNGEPLSFTVYDGVALVWLAVVLASYVVTCLWLHRVRLNTHLLAGTEQHARSPIWAWLGWWVPVVSLWFPYQVVRDVQKVSLYGTRVTAVSLGLWWSCWLAWLAGTRVTGGLATSPEGYGALPVVEVVLSALLAVALWRWVLVVRQVTTAQRERWFDAPG